MSEEKTRILPAPCDKNHVSLVTGSNICLKQLARPLLIDAHMHIMSLNCTPMPLQWATAYLQAGGLGKSVGDERDKVTKLTRFWLVRWIATKDFGRVGQFSTNLIADMYMGQAKNANMEEHLFWLLRSLGKPGKPFETEDERIEAGKTLRLEKLTEKRSVLKSFNNITDDYYTSEPLTRMNIAMPMDLSYAHYWGLHDLPIYLPILNGSTFCIINDFYYVQKGKLKITYEPLENENTDKIMLFYSTSFHDLPTDIISFTGKLNKDYWGEGSDEKNFYLENRKPYKHYLMEVEGDSTEMFEDYWEQVALHEGAALRYPLQIIPFFHYDPRRYYLKGTKDAILDALNTKHGFFDIVENDDKKTEISFYDFSPKPPKKEIKAASKEEIKAILKEKPTPMASRAYFDTIFFKGYNKEPSVVRNPLKKQVLPPSKKTHEDCVSDYLYPKGSFLGVKLYPPLGYPADLASDEQQKRFDYVLGRFENYNKLFRHCIKYNLPITAHASPLGFSIADGHNYFLRDTQDYILDTTEFPPKEVTIQSMVENEKRPLASFLNVLNDKKVSRKNYTLYVDEITTHPMHWRRLLELKSTAEVREFKSLTLCLAHFSGMEAWINNARLKDLQNQNLREGESLQDLKEELRKLQKELLISPELGKLRLEWFELEEILQKRYEREDLERKDWRQATIDLINDFPNVYTDISYYAFKGSKSKILDVAKQMADMIKAKPNLRWRILMGSDWYMTEMAGKGVDVYYADMFTLLRELTRILKEEHGEKWDAWHQFSVINPLLFLGFLQPENRELMEADPKTDSLKKPTSTLYNGKSYYTPDYTRLKEVYDNIKKKDTKDWRKLASVPIRPLIDEFDEIYSQNLKKLPKKIYTADSMQKGDDLAILQF